MAAMAMTLLGRSFFITKNHRVGVTQVNAGPGDKIVILVSCDMLLILRDVQQSDEKLLVGECYEQGVMNG